MYQPPHFRENDVALLHDFIAAHPLALLISADEAGPVANQVPFLLYPDEGPSGVLRAHLARANTQWQALDRPDARALLVFQGANHYITPAWYAQKALDGKVVPTWNYAMVQVRGRVSVSHDPAWLLAHVGALTDRNERLRPRPWAVTDAPEPYVAGQLRGIVGIEVAIEQLAGKFKLSQNRPEADRRGVVAGLADEFGRRCGGNARAGATAQRALSPPAIPPPSAGPCGAACADPTSVEP